MTYGWTTHFIAEHKCYIAWDETQANEIGRFLSYDEARNAVLEYAKTLKEKEK